MQLSTHDEGVIATLRDREELTWVYVGKAKTEHRSAGLTQGEATNTLEYPTLCRKIASQISEAQEIPYDADLEEEKPRDPKPLGTKCKGCATAEAEIDASEGDHVVWQYSTIEEIDALSTDDNDDNEETETVATKKTADETPAADKTNDEIAEEVKAYIDGLVENEFPKYNKGDKDKIDALAEQAERELLRVSANKRAVWRTLVKDAKAEAMERTGGTEVAVREEVTSVEQIENYAEVIEHTAGVVADSIKSEVDAQEAAKKVASAILDGRLRVTDKKGRPDLKGTRQASRDLATAVYDKAAEKLIAEEYGSDVADVDELLKGLKFKVGYQMSAVLPEFVRALDNSPEEFADLFPNMEVPEGKSPSDVVFSEYGINPKSKAELAADKRRAKKELATKVEAGELTQADADAEAEKLDAEGEGSTRAEKSQFEKDTAKLDKVAKELLEIIGRKEERTEEEAKAIREKFNATITALTEGLTKL